MKLVAAQREEKQCVDGSGDALHDLGGLARADVLTRKVPRSKENGKMKTAKEIGEMNECRELIKVTRRKEEEETRVSKRAAETLADVAKEEKCLVSSPSSLSCLLFFCRSPSFPRS